MAPPVNDHEERIRWLLKTYPGISRKEISYHTGLSINTVSKHINNIRATWLSTWQSG